MYGHQSAEPGGHSGPVRYHRRDVRCVDGVILDSGNSKVFVFAGNDGVTGSSATVVQASTSLASTVRVGVGQGSKGIGSAGVPVDIHMAAFDNNYFGATPSTG